MLHNNNSLCTHFEVIVYGNSSSMQMTYYCRIVNVFKGKVLIWELYNTERSRWFERVGMILIFFLRKKNKISIACGYKNHF